MKIFVHAKAGAKTPSIRTIDDTHVIISVKEPPQDGKANAAIARALARHLGVAPSRITLLRGAASKRKVFALS